MLEQNTLVLGTPNGGEFKVPMSHSISNFMQWDAHNAQVYNSTLSIRSPLIEDNRNVIARTFLDIPNAKWLLFIDYDIEFTPDRVYMLLSEADEMEKRILTGLYFGQILNTSTAIVPMWFGTESEEGYHIANLKGTMSGSSLQPLVNCGAGFLLIHKSVLEEFPDLDGDPWRWFGRDLYKLNGKTIRLGEDMTFGRRAGKLGISIWGHNGCTLTHYKEQRITLEAYFDEQKRIADRAGSRRDKILAPSPELKEWQGLITLDINPDHKPDIVADLNITPWPIEDEIFDEVHGYEVLEHLGRQGDAKSFFATFSEIYRILKPDGFLFATVPMWNNTWAWGDPSHTRVITEGSLAFLSQKEYKDQVGKTPMSDFRYMYKDDFNLLFRESKDGTFIFALQVVKPSRYDK